MKNNDATHTGVSDENELTEEEKQEIEQKGREAASSFRLNALDAIAANVDRDRVEQDGMELDIKDETKHALPDKDTATTDLTDEEKQTVKLVVDGTEQEVPMSKVLDAGKRTLQKETVADKRLEEATNLRKAAEKMLADAKKVTSGDPKADEGKPDDDKPLAEDPEYQTKKKGWVQAIQYGEEAEAEKAIDDMMDFMRRGSTTTTSKDDLSTLVDQALAEREERKRQEDLEVIRVKFKSPVEEGGFNDLANSPYLMDEVVKLVDDKLAKGEENNWELYENVGNEIRQRREKALGKKVSDNLDERRRKKTSIDSLRSADAKKSSQTTVPDDELSEEEIRRNAISDIMKSRGQTL